MHSWILKPIGAVLVAAVAAGGVIATRHHASAPAPVATTTAPHGCLAVERCFPKPTNTGPGATGIPPRTKLRDCGDSITVTRPGKVINACRFSGTVTIKAPHVTIRNSRIHDAV